MANLLVLTSLLKVTGDITSTNFLLLDNGFFLLLDSGDKLIL